MLSSLLAHKEDKTRVSRRKELGFLYYLAQVSTGVRVSLYNLEHLLLGFFKVGALVFGLAHFYFSLLQPSTLVTGSLFVVYVTLFG